MKQITPWSDVRLAGQCPYCGGRGDTRDHVPFKALLDRPYPENLPTVPACSACNEGFSLDEQYVAAFLEFVVNGAEGLSARKDVVRGLDRATGEGLEARLMAALRTDGEHVWVEAEAQRVDRIVLKLARGHALYELSEPWLGPPGAVRWVALDTLSPEARASFDRPVDADVWPEIGSRSFIRMGASTIDEPAEQSSVATSGWTTVQEGRYRFLTVVRSDRVVVRMVLRDYLACEVIWAS